MCDLRPLTSPAPSLSDREPVEGNYVLPHGRFDSIPSLTSYYTHHRVTGGSCFWFLGENSRVQKRKILT